MPELRTARENARLEIRSQHGRNSHHTPDTSRGRSKKKFMVTGGVGWCSERLKMGGVGDAGPKPAWNGPG